MERRRYPVPGSHDPDYLNIFPHVSFQSCRIRFLCIAILNKAFARRLASVVNAITKFSGGFWISIERRSISEFCCGISSSNSSKKQIRNRNRNLLLNGFRLCGVTTVRPLRIMPTKFLILSAKQSLTAVPGYSLLNSSPQAIPVPGCHFF